MNLSGWSQLETADSSGMYSTQNDLEYSPQIIIYQISDFASPPVDLLRRGNVFKKNDKIFVNNMMTISFGSGGFNDNVTQRNNDNVTLRNNVTLKNTDNVTLSNNDNVTLSNNDNVTLKNNDYGWWNAPRDERPACDTENELEKEMNIKYFIPSGIVEPSPSQVERVRSNISDLWKTSSPDQDGQRVHRAATPGMRNSYSKVVQQPVGWNRPEAVPEKKSYLSFENICAQNRDPVWKDSTPKAHFTSPCNVPASFSGYTAWSSAPDYGSFQYTDSDAESISSAEMRAELLQKPPIGYICHLCGRHGHYIKDCKLQFSGKLQLTPYQGAKRCYGEFMCPKCMKKWESFFSWADKSQKCAKCHVFVYPRKQKPLDIMARRDDWPKLGALQKIHPRLLCQCCIESNQDCSRI